MSGCHNKLFYVKIVQMACNFPCPGCHGVSSGWVLLLFALPRILLQTSVKMFNHGCVCFLFSIYLSIFFFSFYFAFKQPEPFVSQQPCATHRENCFSLSTPELLVLFSLRVFLQIMLQNLWLKWCRKNNHNFFSEWRGDRKHLLLMHSSVWMYLITGGGE